MTSHTNIARQPAGSPDGGKFAAKPGGAEADYTLAARGGDGALSVIMQVTHSDIDDEVDAEDESWRESMGSTQADGYGNWSAMVKPGPQSCEHAMAAIRSELRERGAADGEYLETMAARRRPERDENGFECWEEAESTERYAKKVIDHVDWDDTAQAAYDGDAEAMNVMVSEAWEGWEGIPDSERENMAGWVANNQDKIAAMATGPDSPLTFPEGATDADRTRGATEFLYLYEAYDNAM